MKNKRSDLGGVPKQGIINGSDELIGQFKNNIFMKDLVSWGKTGVQFYPIFFLRKFVL